MDQRTWVRACGFDGKEQALPATLTVTPVASLVMLFTPNMSVRGVLQVAGACVGDKVAPVAVGAEVGGADWMTRSVPEPKPELLLYAPSATKYVWPALIKTGVVTDVKELHP